MPGTPRARKLGLLTETLGHETIVFDQDNNVAHTLSEQSTAVWNACDGTRAPSEIGRFLGFDEAVTTAALDELDANGLLEYSSEMGYSRREATKKVVKLGAAAAAAPMIYSLAIAPALAMASPISCNTMACRGTSGISGVQTVKDALAKQNADAVCSGAPACTPASTCNGVSTPGSGADQNKRVYTGTCVYT